MKKVIVAFLAILFLAACSGNADRKNESTAPDEQIEAMDKELEQIQSATEEVNEAADALSEAADSLLNSL